VLRKKFTDILKIKGLGLQTLAVIVAETAGFAAFENGAQLVSYAGYDIIENQSGKHTGKTRISKRGNSHIRRALHFAAFNAVRYEVGMFPGLYERIYERSKIKMKGYVAIQKKLLTLIYVLWKKDEAFDPDYIYGSNKEEKTAIDTELKPSLATDARIIEEQDLKRVTPVTKTRATEDRHPTTRRRMPSLAKSKITEKT